MAVVEGESAVALFAADGPLHSLLSYGEFDAILFRAANLEPFAGELVRCIYVTIEPDLSVSGAVCFLMRTDQSGFVPDFSLPLDQLLRLSQESGAPQPPVISRNNCPLADHRTALWQPEPAQIRALIEVVRKNELGYYVRRAEPQSSAPSTASSSAPAHFTANRSLEGMLGELERARDEIYRLRAALRHEQDRNRRLQDALLSERPGPR